MTRCDHFQLFFNCYVTTVGPGLAQLEERLTHRYSESTSSNPGNLTSATVCGDRTGSMLAAKRLACVAPEVDLGECTLHSPPQKANKAESTLALKPRGDVTRNPKQGYQWPQKRTCVCVRQKLKKHNKTRNQGFMAHLINLSAMICLICRICQRVRSVRQICEAVGVRAQPHRSASHGLTRPHRSASQSKSCDLSESPICEAV